MDSITGSIVGSVSGASSIYTDNTSVMHNPNYESLTNIVVDDYRPLKPYEFNLTLPTIPFDGQERLNNDFGFLSHFYDLLFITHWLIVQGKGKTMERSQLLQ